MISGIIKVEVSIINRRRRLRLMTLTETLIILAIIVLLYIVLKKIMKTHYVEEANQPAMFLLRWVNLTLLLELHRAFRAQPTDN